MWDRGMVSCHTETAERASISPWSLTDFVSMSYRDREAVECIPLVVDGLRIGGFSRGVAPRNDSVGQDRRGGMTAWDKTGGAKYKKERRTSLFRVWMFTDEGDHPSVSLFFVLLGKHGNHGDSRRARIFFIIIALNNIIPCLQHFSNRSRSLP